MTFRTIETMHVASLIRSLRFNEHYADNYTWAAQRSTGKDRADLLDAAEDARRRCSEIEQEIEDAESLCIPEWPGATDVVQFPRREGVGL